ncbi:hypothetical protein TTHERM_00444720 (macronuclear) [Tetrahymena thermophila SB210]|uniref:Uncharacterized protein n=1 Tax=Tetrahymena thermophila (strain SB210) TaxID=312017 RepID=I7M3G2_TETTS|nr:hypothetical protein TTHERM_00444720 [Tetrahymena thermophila SB210]EAS03090.4 hypothetical protein TTHERM_00444720 [Tetrahymena thermophila SB210]|eukprot:XP_001023335.4 hypothetical protein TTHERM_00444720 [Tetrahymena thermophila SB210]
MNLLRLIFQHFTILLLKYSKLLIILVVQLIKKTIAYSTNIQQIIFNQIFIMFANQLLVNLENLKQIFILYIDQICKNHSKNQSKKIFRNLFYQITSIQYTKEISQQIDKQIDIQIQYLYIIFYIIKAMSKVPQPQNQNNHQIITQNPQQPPSQIQQQQNLRPQQQQQSSYQVGAMRIIDQIIAQTNKMKEELKQKKSSNPEQRLREAVKKQLNSQERYLRSSNSYQLEDQRRLHKIPAQDLLNCISIMTKIHLEKKTEVEQNINKNIELLKFLQQYKANNPQQNFQERENSQQQASNNYNLNEDSFEQIVEEAQKEIKNQNIYTQSQQQYQEMDQEAQYYYQGTEVQNNEMLDRQPMEYPEEDFQYI